MAILAIDAGTTGVTAMVVSLEGKVLSRGYQEFEQHFPQPGWVEHQPEQIWQRLITPGRHRCTSDAIPQHGEYVLTAVAMLYQIGWQRA